MMPWKRLDMNGQPHDHGYTACGEEIRTAFVTHDNQGKTEVTGGLKNMKASLEAQTCFVCLKCFAVNALPLLCLPPIPCDPLSSLRSRFIQLLFRWLLLYLQVLKTTQSGYVGFLHDKFTTLPDVADRIVATSVAATWK